MKEKILFFITLAIGQSSFAQQKLTPSDAGSKVNFVIRNFGMKTNGNFTGLKGAIQFDPVNFGTSSFDISVDAATVDTDNSSRDAHLRKTDYFDVEKYKTIHFKSTKVVRSSVAGRFFVFGILTIKNISKPVQFGFSATPKNNGYIFEGEFEINRRDFGVGGSSISLSDKLKVILSVLAIK